LRAYLRAKAASWCVPQAVQRASRPADPIGLTVTRASSRCLPKEQPVFLDADIEHTLPELQALRGLVERTDWHNDDPSEQALRLWRWLKHPPGPQLETTTVSVQSLNVCLAARIDTEGKYTTHELLTFTALIHDVGKAETYQLQSDGTTRCPGHEAVGAWMARDICERFDFSRRETDFIIRLVGGHGGPYALFKRIAPLPEPEREELLRHFEDEWGDELLPLLLLAYGDLITSHLRSRCPEKYAAILTFYQAWLGRLVSRPTEDGSGTDP